MRASQSVSASVRVPPDASCAARGRARPPVWLVVSAVLALDTGFQAQAPAPPADVEQQFYSARDRLAALRMASLFVPAHVSEVDIVRGAPQRTDQFQLLLNDTVTCEFARPGAEKSGKTPKFDCRITRVESADGRVQSLTPEMDEEPLKVKFGPANREIYAEVTGTRLLWALGFFADSMFPVRLVCLDCPEDPHEGKGPKATRLFPEAVIERKAAGREMEEKGRKNQGWTWKEFEHVDRPVHQKDGLKLIAAFIMHGDNKAEQQRMMCDGVTVDQRTDPFTTTCGASRAYVQDVGATFGGAGATTNGTTAKMNLEKWAEKKVWKKVGTVPDQQECQAELPKSWAAGDGLGHPIISEDGRRFAAGLLCQLSDRQLADLFTVSRVAELPENRTSTEAAVVQRWVDAFKRKREELAAGRCRWKAKPADLADIDNPMGLPAVPNFCSARPF
jgi:hypothetical protein